MTRPATVPAPGARATGASGSPEAPRRPAILPICLMLLTALAGTASAEGSKTKLQPDSILNRVRFDQKPGAAVPLDLTFRDEEGRAIKLGDLFGKRPVILELAYYRCPTLCTLGITGLTRALKPLTPSAGKDFEVVIVSIDPTESPELARAKKESYLDLYHRPGTEAGWHFLTGEAKASAALADAVGFRYTYNPASKQYAHPAGYMILTPSGKVSRYLFGIEPSSKDLQAAVADAGREKVGRESTWLPLLCYDYDAATGKYTLSIVRILRLAGTTMALGLASFLFVMFRREHRAGRTRPEPAASQAPGDIPPPPAPPSET